MIFISILIIIVAMALPSFNKQLSPVIFTRISSIIFIYAGALSFNALNIQSIGSGIGIYSGLFHVTNISQLIEIFLLVIGSMILISWPLNNNNIISLEGSEIKKEIINKNDYAKKYSLIVLFSTLGASFLVSTYDLISMYLSLELQSFGVYILATLYRDSESATSAGLKYFLLGGLSSCLILLGAGLIYSFTGLTNFETIYSIISVSESNTIIQGFNFGIILIIVGLLFKIAAAPLHNWAPDVYNDSPTIVTIWLTIMPKLSIIILLLELITQIGNIGGFTSISLYSTLDLLNSITSVNFFSNSEGITLIIKENTSYILKTLLLISSIFSLIIGTVVGLAQTKIKRLLAYSTISHIGFILLALAINTEQSIDSLIFYIIQYSITNLNTFLIILALGYIIQQSVNLNKLLQINTKPHSTNLSYFEDSNIINEKQNKEGKDIMYISEFKGQFLSNPLLSLSFAVCLFSMAGIPPLIGFFSKQLVLYSAIQNGYYFMAIICILVSVISASYYLNIIKVLHDDQEAEISSVKDSNLKNIKNFKNSELKLTNFHSFLISSLTLTILLFVLKPSIFLNLTQLLSLSLYNL
jgi:NADH-ubiquinone oxidoreductase chain 2